MINLYFNAEKQILTRTDREDLASNSREIHQCNFALSDDWANMQITVVFKYMGRKWDVLLAADNTCIVPAEVLEGQEGFTVGLYGVSGDKVITSTLITVPVSKGANVGGIAPQITPSMYDQIMAKMEDLEEEIEQGTGVTPVITANATVDNTIGTPEVNVTKSGPITAPEFTFAFTGLKGADGEPGAPGAPGAAGQTPTVSASATVSASTGTPTVNVTKGGTDAAPEFNFAFSGLKGEAGATPAMTANATVDNTSGTPTVNVTKGGTDAAPEYTFAFTGLKGQKGDPGTGAEELEEDITSLWGITDKHNMANILPYNYFDGNGRLSSYVSYSVNEDKSININGTSTSYSFYRLVFKDTTFLRKGKYVISCEEMLPTGVYVHVGVANNLSNPDDIGTYLAIINENNDGSTSKAFEISENGLPIIVRIMVFPNASANNLNVHIMLRYANDPVTAWQSPLINANTLKEQIDNMDCYPCFSMFNKFGVVGDSFSSGYIAPNPNVHSFVTNYTLSWGQVLARLSGNTCQNFSAAGLTTKTWLTDAAHGKAALEAAAAQDLYVICLGINDYTTATYNLGSTADIGTATDSFYSYYSQIIECIQNHAPNAKIIVSTMRQGRVGGNASFTADQVNAAIEAIAEHYGLPCVKPSEDSLFTSAYYLTKMSQSHPVAAVYSAMAKAYKRLIEKAIENNFEYFESYTDNT